MTHVTIALTIQRWDVYVSQSSNKNKEKGFIPSSSIIEAFVSLSPQEDVTVYPANWKKHPNPKDLLFAASDVKRPMRQIDHLSYQQSKSTM
jgi:hypothetical protein